MPKKSKRPAKCHACRAPRTKRPHRSIKVKGRKLPVCRACYECWTTKGTFERTPPRWHREAPKIAAMRKRGVSIAEIVEAFPGLPRRTAYAICNRYGLHGVWGYEVGQGGKRAG